MTKLKINEKRSAVKFLRITKISPAAALKTILGF